MRNQSPVPNMLSVKRKERQRTRNQNSPLHVLSVEREEGGGRSPAVPTRRRQPSREIVDRGRHPGSVSKRGLYAVHVPDGSLRHAAQRGGHEHVV